jgi:spore germination protein YaaH
MGREPTYTEPYLTVFNNPVSENGLAEAFTYTQVKSREAGSIERFLDPYSLEKVMKYSYQGGTYMLYYPDHETHAYRLDLAKKYNIAGVAHWRLGNEDPFIYQLVANY